MMDRHSVQILLAQTLETYQRCGIRWVGNDGEIPSDWKDAIASLAEDASDKGLSKAESAQSTSVQSAGNTPPFNVAQPVAQPKPSSPSTVARPEAMQVPCAPAGSWESPELDDAARHNLFQILDQEIRACRKCTEICPYRRQTVFGEGPIRPTVCFMGEAPGADEDAQGRPFVGSAGQLLTQIIGAMQLKREEVYILNSLKCRPPGNRNPSPDEILNCYPFVESQLETLRPKYIVCLGAIAARSLLKRDTPVGQMRGRFYQYRGARVLVTYHPSYLLRNVDAKRLVWEDMQLLMRELGISLPPKK